MIVYHALKKMNKREMMRTIMMMSLNQMTKYLIIAS
jgi:hypothetical protein